MLKPFGDNEFNLNQKYCLFGIALIHQLHHSKKSLSFKFFTFTLDTISVVSGAVNFIDLFIMSLLLRNLTSHVVLGPVQP